jgi:prefoldin subunit 5
MPKSFGTKEELEVKLKEYSTFIDRKLHPELKKRVDAREQVEEEIADYRDLSTKLKALDQQDGDSPLEAMVDLGHDTVYCRGVASAESKQQLMMHVHVGMGFHVELTIPEALAFSEKRIRFLEQILKKRVEASTMVARHIESSLLILEELAREMRDYD